MENTNMKISFSCNNCGTGYTALPEQEGKRGNCKNCGSEIVVPITKASNHTLLAISVILSFSLAIFMVTNLPKEVHSGISIIYVVFFGLIFTFVNYIVLGALWVFLSGGIDSFKERQWKLVMFSIIGLLFTLIGYCSLYKN